MPEFLGIWESVCNNPEWEQVRTRWRKVCASEPVILEYDQRLLVHCLVQYRIHRLGTLASESRPMEIVFVATTSFRFVDLHSRTEKLLSACGQCSSFYTNAELFGLDYCHVDCGHVGQRELVSTASQRSVHGHQELLPSVEHRRLSTGLDRVPCKVIASLR